MQRVNCRKHVHEEMTINLNTGVFSFWHTRAFRCDQPMRSLPPTTLTPEPWCWVSQGRAASTSSRGLTSALVDLEQNEATNLSETASPRCAPRRKTFVFAPRLAGKPVSLAKFPSLPNTVCTRVSEQLRTFTSKNRPISILTSLIQYPSHVTSQTVNLSFIIWLTAAFTSLP